MSPDQNHNPPATKKDEAGSSGSRKAAAAAAAATAAAAAEQAVKCPRCDSPNTKFCYYNNYSLTQPRHFCKTCRRYWTKGGALRNVPIGGGCRKNKKIKTSSSGVSSRLSDSDIGAAGGFKFFHGLSPAIDFQLSGGGLSSPSFPRLHHHHNTGSSGGGIYSNSHFASFGVDSHAPSAASPFDPSGNSLMGLSYGPPAVLGGGAIQEMNNNNNLNSNTNNIASSIESLSCINQDLHWKLQQQRLAMLFGNGGGGENKDHTTTTTAIADHASVVAPLGQHHQQQKLLEPILFRNLEISSSNSRKDQGGGGDVANEWFFGNSYANHATAGGGGDGNDVSMTTTTSWSGVQAWSDNLQQQQHQQYTALP